MQRQEEPPIVLPLFIEKERGFSAYDSVGDSDIVGRDGCSTLRFLQKIEGCIFFCIEGKSRTIFSKRCIAAQSELDGAIGHALLGDKVIVQIIEQGLSGLLHCVAPSYSTDPGSSEIGATQRSSSNRCSMKIITRTQVKNIGRLDGAAC